MQLIIFRLRYILGLLILPTANVLLTLAFMTQADAQTLGKSEYLAKNHEVLSFDQPNKFELFDKNFYSNQIFLLGEMHGSADSYRIARMLAEEFKKKTNFRFYAPEITHIDAVYINKYLDTGDESFLKKNFELNRGTFYYSQDYYRCFTHIRGLNEKLPAKDRIRFIGVDIISPSDAALEYLLELTNSVGYKKGKLPMLDETSSVIAATKLDEQREKFVNKLLADIRQNEKFYQRVFGKKFWELEFLVENFVASFPIQKHRRENSSTSVELENVRDEQMAKNFGVLYRQLNLQKEKIFGFFGREHIYKAEGKRTKWMTARIKENNPALKIVSLDIRYLNSQFMIPSFYLRRYFGEQKKLYFFGNFLSDESPFMKAVGTEDLGKISPTEKTVLFRLNEENSPYRSLPDLIKEIGDGKATTDNIDYAILARNSVAAAPVAEK